MNRILLAMVILFVLLPASCRLWAAGEDADFRRAQHLYTLHEYKMAVEAFTKYLGDFPKSERAEQARLLLAESEYQLKDYLGAGKDLDKFLAEYASSTRRADALQRAVKVHWYLKDYARSVECSEIFLKENRERLGKAEAPPSLPGLFEQVLYYAGDSSYGLKKYDQARVYWERLQKEFPKSTLLPDAEEGLGWIAFESNMYEDAIKHFTLPAQTADHPKAAASQLMVARAIDRLGKAAEALVALEKVAGLTGGKEQARDIALWRSVFLLHAKRYSDAVAACRVLTKSYAEHPDTPLVILQAMNQLEEEAQNSEALELADLYLGTFSKGPGRPLSARIKARMLLALKRDGAVAAAEAAVKEAEALPANSTEYQEQRPAALILLAELSGSQGQPYYQTVIKDHAESRFALPARYQLALLQAQAGKLQEALAQTQALLKQLEDTGTAPSLSAPIQAERNELRRKTLFAAADYAFRVNSYELTESYLKTYSELPVVKAQPGKMQMDLVQLRLAWCRHAAHDFAGAIARLDKALSANPPVEGELHYEMLYLRGRARLDAATAGTENQDVAKALDDYATLVKEAPASSFVAHACYEAAQVLSRTKPADALPWCDKLLDGAQSGDPQLILDGLLLRARTRYALGKNQEALSDIEALFKHPEKTKEQATAACVIKGLCLEALPGKEADAEKAYTELIAAGPENAPEVRIAHSRRGKLRFNAGRFQDAQPDLKAFVGDKELKTSDSAELEAAVLVAVCSKELKDAAGAQAQFEKLVKLQLSGAAAFEVPFQLGNLYYESGKHADAAIQYARALEAAALSKDIPAPALSAAWLNLAWCYRRCGEARKAEAAFDSLIKLDPTGAFSAEARYHRGRILSELDNPDGAVSLWNEIVNKQAASPFAEQALAAVANTQLKMGRLPEVLKTYEQYLTLYPTGEGNRNALCGLAECRLRDKKPDGAREAYLKALGAKGTDAELDDIGERAILGLAQLALDANKAEESKKLALRIVIDKPESKSLDQALLLCAKASEEMKEPAQAIGYYRKLLTDRPKSDCVAAARERLQALGAPAETGKKD